MITPLNPENEEKRLESLQSYNILDSLPEKEFDDITALASEICQTKISAVSLIDQDRQWFKSIHGLEATETPRDIAYCAHAINEPNTILEVEDATKDHRFVGNPLLTGEPHVRFYAGVPLVNKEGFALGTICVIDSTPKKLTKNQINSLKVLSQHVITLMELRKRERYLNFFESAFKESSEGIAWVNKEATLVHFNQRYSELIGINKTVLKTKKVFEFDANFTEKMWKAHWEEMLDKKSMSIETEFKGEDGKIRTVELRLKLIDYNGEKLINALVLDISVKKESIAKISENSFVLEKVQSIAHIGYWELNLIEGTIYWSQETRRIHEASDDFVPTLETGINFYDEESRPIISEKVTRAIENGENFDVQLKIISAKGNLKWIRSVGKAQFENGKAIKLVGVFQDISKEVELRETLEEKRKQAEEASMAKNRFLSAMSHEIRTPLNGIIGAAYLLKNKAPKPEQLEYIHMLNDSSLHLLSLVDNVLDFGKIEEGKIELENINFDLKQLVTNTIHPWKIQTEDKGLAFMFEYSDELSNIYIGDPTRIRQVLNNLLSNALKFTSKGHIKISVNKNHTNNEAEAEEIEFLVEDTGIGISDENKKSVFQDFTQADNSITRKFGGSGLGLTITKELLKLMGSEIDLTSKLKKGSKFSFCLSLSTDNIEIDNINEYDQEDINNKLKDRIILLVEDNEFNRRIAQDYLETWGAVVVTAVDGLKALKAIASKAFDLILMDLQMPNLDGYNASKLIRELDGDYFKKIPIIALTASALVNSRNKVLEAGMNDFLTKPLKPIDLYQGIKKYLVNKNRETDLKENISLDYFKSIAESSGTPLKTFLEIFEKGIIKDVEQLKVSLEENNSKEISFVIHKNKSAMRTLGLNDLADKAEFFETAINNDTPLCDIKDDIVRFCNEDLDEALKSLNNLIK